MRHEEKYEKLERLGDWKLRHKEQDIRGRPLVSPTGEEYGIIDDLIVDPAKEHVAAIRLKDGRMCGVEWLDIEANKVIYREPPAGHTPTYSAVQR